MDVQRDEFEDLVAKAIEDLPDEFQEKMENVDVVVQDWPTQRQIRRARILDRRQLLGLYEGVPQTRRGRGYAMVLPDKITIFRKPIEMQSRSSAEVRALIGEVVLHELAHHFGLDERALHRIGRKRRSF
jgi:predicted Zn-dependent protease with MMP-like domain